MGTFVGHVAPGVVFIILASLWALAGWNHFYQSRYSSSRNKFGGRRKVKPGSRSHLSNSLFCWPEFPFDGVFKLVLAILGALSETVPVPLLNLPWVPHTFHHVAMYSFVGLSGAVDLLVSAGVELPENTDYTALALAFIIEGLLFYYHVYGRPPLDVQVHMLLLFAIVALVILILVEMKFKDQYLPPLLRSIAIMVQGTWLIHIGFILYNPVPGYVPWNQFDVEGLMMVTVYFSVHIAGAIIFVILSGLFMFLWNKRKFKLADNNGSCVPLLTDIQGSGDPQKEQILASSENGKNKIMLDSE